MKKLITILAIMIVLVGAVFADTGAVNDGTQMLTLSTDVFESVPQFIFQGTFESNYTSLVDAVATTTQYAGGPLNSTVSIADSDIDVYFIITQNASKKVSDASAVAYARTQKTITFTITIGALTQTDGPTGVTPATVAGAIVGTPTPGAKGSYQVNNTSYQNKITNTYDSATKTFTAVYDGRVQNDQEIGRFQARWAQDPTVPNGNYKADITVLIASN